MAKEKTTKEKGISKANQVEIAMNLYIDNLMTQREIANLVGVNENTIKSWIDKNNWEVLRGAKEAGRGTIIANILRRVSTLTATENYSSDDLIKNVKALEYLSPNKITVSGQIATIKQFMSFLYETDYTIAKAIADKELSKKFLENRVHDAITTK